MSPALADIALPVPVDRLFTYLVPPHLASAIHPGMRVLVPFGRKHLTGIIVGLPVSTTVQGLKPLKDLLDSEPTFSADLLKLTKWIADYYLVPWGEVLRAATPHGFVHESKALVSLSKDGLEAMMNSPRITKQQMAILAMLRESPQSVSALRNRTKISSPYSILRDMERKGWLAIEEQIRGPKAKPKVETFVQLVPEYRRLLEQLPKPLTAKQNSVVTILTREGTAVKTAEVLRTTGTSLATLRTLTGKGVVEMLRREVFRGSSFSSGPPPSLTLNPSQQEAKRAVSAALDSGRYETFLLHGVTGSGKTEVYIEAIRHALNRGNTALVLVPEISLTPQTVRRFRSHFNDDVTVMHSQMSIGERFDAWRRARDGKARIVIGPRSAVFAPLKNLGLIIIDEEHEASYKQFDASPRYNARDCAIVRASLTNAIVVLGSATPSVESYQNAQSGKYKLLQLRERVDNAKLPSIAIVDMAQERKEVLAQLRGSLKDQGKPFPKQMPQSSVSRLLEKHISDRLGRKEGVILLQNRRGFSHVVECFECGYVERCSQCDVTMTYHSVKKHIRCHYCGTVKKPPVICPSCGGNEIRFHAFGTQQVHEELRERFPQAGILRMDLDTTSRKGSHDKLLEQFGNRKADILLGTQMVAKGLDFPHVTLVGVISADTQMLLPDFRASERTFQLLTQVAGRAGRSALEGEVIVQTMQPHHYSLKHVPGHDYEGFYKEELAFREELDYPPFSRIVLAEFKGKNETEVQSRAAAFADRLRKNRRDRLFEVLGPADAAIPRIKNLFRKHVIVKSFKTSDPNGVAMRGALQQARTAFESERKRGGVTLTIDIDPQGMM